MADFHFSMPGELKAGPQVWKVVNNGAQPHELAILKLAPGKTPPDVATFVTKPSGPPPFASMGGMQALQPGRSGYVNLDLEPGNYMAVCFVPDPQSGKPHVQLGMAMPFSVK
jgi:hypothetical protein